MNPTKRSIEFQITNLHHDKSTCKDTQPGLSFGRCLFGTLALQAALDVRRLLRPALGHDLSLQAIARVSDEEGAGRLHDESARDKSAYHARNGKGGNETHTPSSPMKRPSLVILVEFWYPSLSSSTR